MFFFTRTPENLNLFFKSGLTVGWDGGGVKLSEFPLFAGGEDCDGECGVVAWRAPSGESGVLHRSLDIPTKKNRATLLKNDKSLVTRVYAIYDLMKDFLAGSFEKSDRSASSGNDGNSKWKPLPWRGVRGRVALWRLFDRLEPAAFYVWGPVTASFRVLWRCLKQLLYQLIALEKKIEFFKVNYELY